MLCAHCRRTEGGKSGKAIQKRYKDGTVCPLHSTHNVGSHNQQRQPNQQGESNRERDKNNNMDQKIIQIRLNNDTIVKRALINSQGLSRWLQKLSEEHGLEPGVTYEYLLDADGVGHDEYATLKPEAIYSLPPIRKKQKREEIQKREGNEEDKEFKQKLDKVVGFILKQEQDSETLLISQPETQRYSNAMSRIGVVKNAPLWNDKPSDLPNAPPRFTWLPSKEDSTENRAAYMEYLRNPENIVLPRDAIIFDGNADGEFLNVRMEGFRVKTSGNIDVLLAESRHQSLATLRENLLGAFELKKDTNKEHAKIERQVTIQHLAASYLNPNTGILTVMTDLHDRWHFFWFTKNKQLMRYEATGSEARFLIEHMLDEPTGNCVSTPTGFLSRASWNDLFLARSVTESPEAEDSTNPSDKGGENDKGNDLNGKPSSVPKGASPLSRNTEFGGARNIDGGHSVGSDKEELNLSLASPLDSMDKDEELESVLHIAMHTSFHRMLGPSQAEVGDFPPPEIDF